MITEFVHVITQSAASDKYHDKYRDESVTKMFELPTLFN